MPIEEKNLPERDASSRSAWTINLYERDFTQVRMDVALKVRHTDTQHAPRYQNASALLQESQTGSDIEVFEEMLGKNGRYRTVWKR